MKKLIIVLAILSSVSAFADSGVCTGSTASGKEISIYYYTNTWTDDDIEYYTDIVLEQNIPATYWLTVKENEMKGEVTKRSFRNDHLDFGSAKFQITEDHTVMSGSLGKETFEGLKCTYSLVTE